MNRTWAQRDYGFVIGLLAGACVGAGLATWIAPRLASGPQRMTDSARNLGQRLSEQYQRVSSRVGEAVEELSGKVKSERDEVADEVAGRVPEVERFATAAQSDRVTGGRVHPDRSASTIRSL